MVIAASTGCLDYKEADSEDNRWLLHEVVALDYVEEQQLLKLRELRFFRQSVLGASWPMWDSKGELYNHHFDASEGHLTRIGQILLPYLTWDKRSVRKKEAAELRQDYTRKFGDPDDPKVKEELARLEASLKNRADRAREVQQSKHVAELAERRNLAAGVPLRRETWKDRRRRTRSAT